jgi:hypothetical protein
MRIELASNLEQRFRTALHKAEQMKPNHFCMVDFSLDAYSGSHTAFRRDPRTHQRMLDEFFERTGHDFQRFNYLGEWHSHPSFSVHPSSEDVGTMTDIVQGKDSVITFAVLLIVRLRWWFLLDHSVTVFARDRSSELTELRRKIVWL